MDATRGAAMLAVILSHSAQYLSDSRSPIAAWTFVLGMVATPTFLLLSGLVCGHLLTSGERPLVSWRRRLLDRGLFLLLIAHAVLALTHMMMHVAPATAMWGNFYITDAVGVGLIVASVLGSGASGRRCLAAGMILVALGWLGTFVFGISPATHRNLFRLLIGIQDPDDIDDGWIVPVVPYIGIFLMGFAAGIWFSRQRARGVPMRDIASRCARIGLVLILGAILLKSSWLLARHHVAGVSAQIWHDLSDPLQKMPPGPAYELFFGGAALLLFGCICVAAAGRALRPVVSRVATIGRASLVAYVAQYWIISVPARGFGLKGGGQLWLAGLVTAVLGVSALCSIWDRVHGNRLFTVGLGRIAPAVRRASVGT